MLAVASAFALASRSHIVTAWNWWKTATVYDVPNGLLVTLTLGTAIALSSAAIGAFRRFRAARSGPVHVLDRALGLRFRFSRAKAASLDLDQRDIELRDNLLHSMPSYPHQFAAGCGREVVSGSIMFPKCECDVEIFSKYCTVDGFALKCLAIAELKRVRNQGSKLDRDVEIVIPLKSTPNPFSTARAHVRVGR